MPKIYLQSYAFKRWMKTALPAKGTDLHEHDSF